MDPDELKPLVGTYLVVVETPRTLEHLDFIRNWLETNCPEEIRFNDLILATWSSIVETMGYMASAGSVFKCPMTLVCSSEETAILMKLSLNSYAK
jgi:hypothetical protein